MVGCHRCGGRSRAGARFCGACGAVLGSARVGVRKTVSVLFADAPVRAHQDVESGVRSAASFYRGLRLVLEEHGGTVERHVGDAVMAVFGVPSARDDDARRAAAAALAVREVVRSLPGAPEVSVGINTGEVVTGDGSAEQELAVGDPLVVAARLQQLAAPGEVLLGPSTVRLLGAGARYGHSRDVTLKGRVGELSVVPLLGLDATVEVGSRSAFVGRDPERRMLLAALDRSIVTDIVQLVTVLGEAGTGKSRLVREVLRERSDEVTVLRGTCRGYGDRSTWSALVEVLHEVTAVPADGSAAAVLTALENRRPELAGVLPVLASLLGDGDTPIGGAELSWAVARVLALVVGEGPLVVVLEDVHLADGPLLDLLPEVVRRLEGSPVVLVVTARPELLEQRADWGRGLRHVLGLTLRPLDVAASRQLADQLLPGDPEGVDALLGPADGNPLFLEQLAQARAEGAGVAAPSVTAVLAARVDRLPLVTRQVLERAAVIGPWGRPADLLPLCDAEQQIDVEAELLALARRDLLDVEDGRWSFGSELVREAAAAGLTRDDRAELHQVRGLVLATQGANAAAGFHFELASALLRGSDPGRSAALGKQAAARLAAAGLRALTGDLVAAADLLGRATALMPVDEPRRLNLLPELARARQLAGDLTGAGEVLEEAVRRADALGLAESSAHARIARLDLLRSTEPERAYIELPALLSEVLPVLEQVRDDRGLSLAWQLHASALQYRVRWGAMDNPLQKALHHAHRSGDRPLVERAESLQVDSMFHGPMHLDETRVRLESLLEQPGISPSHRAGVEARLAGTLALQGDPVAARAGMTQVRQVLRDLGRELSAVVTALMSGPVELLAGEPDKARDELHEACDALIGMGDKAFTATSAALLAEACWRCKDLVGAAAAVELSRSSAGIGDVITQVRWRSVQAKLYAAQGRAEEALRLSSEAVQLVATTDEVTSQGDVLADGAEVQELLGNLGAAQVLLREAVQRYERKGAPQAIRRLSGRLYVLPSPGRRVREPSPG
ncbi:MAG: adenylate/guanylate cyclase [Frankiales bacterium]|nr:adenylate/guanylate cyclase [Frankiales bacterium]